MWRITGLRKWFDSFEQHLRPSDKRQQLHLERGRRDIPVEGSLIAGTTEIKNLNSFCFVLSAYTF